MEAFAMETAAELRRQAERCRRLAAAITIPADPAVASLHALAADYDRRAAEREATEAAAPAADPHVAQQQQQPQPKQDDE
jgi:hypothetical protein